MRPAGRLALSAAVLAATLVFLLSRSTGEPVPLRRPLDGFPREVGHWQGREALLFQDAIVSNLKMTDYLMRRYADAAGRNVWLFIGYWETQRRGAQIHSPKKCLPGGGWEPLEARAVTVALPAPYAPITVNWYLIQKERDQMLVLYWYHAQGDAIAGEVAARVAMVRSAILRNRTDGALVRIMGPVQGGVAETTERLVAYVQALYPALGEFLPA